MSMSRFKQKNRIQAPHTQPVSAQLSKVPSGAQLQSQDNNQNTQSFVRSTSKKSQKREKTFILMRTSALKKTRVQQIRPITQPGSISPPKSIGRALHSVSQSLLANLNQQDVQQQPHPSSTFRANTKTSGQSKPATSQMYNNVSSKTVEKELQAILNQNTTKTKVIKNAKHINGVSASLTFDKSRDQYNKRQLQKLQPVCTKKIGQTLDKRETLYDKNQSISTIMNGTQCPPRLGEGESYRTFQNKLQGNQINGIKSPRNNVVVRQEQICKPTHKKQSNSHSLNQHKKIFPENVQLPPKKKQINKVESLKEKTSDHSLFNPYDKPNTELLRLLMNAPVIKQNSEQFQKINQERQANIVQNQTAKIKQVERKKTPEISNRTDSEQMKILLAKFYNAINAKKSREPQSILENKTTLKMYQLPEPDQQFYGQNQPINQKSIVLSDKLPEAKPIQQQMIVEKRQKQKQQTKQKVTPKPAITPEIDYEIDDLRLDNYKTDPLLTEKQHIVTLIYDNFQSNSQPLKTVERYYRTGRLLGQGAFGRVILAQHKLTTQFVAIKCLKKSEFEMKHIREKLKIEMQIISKLQHKNIVQLFDSFETRSHVCFVMELCGGGDLHSYIRRRKRLTEETSAFIFKQVCEAVAYCHENSVVHRDIKPDNLLLQDEGKVKLCDFGVSRIMKPEVLFEDGAGTPAFMAPEVLDKIPHIGWPIDVWSLGVLLYIMVYGKIPFQFQSVEELKQLLKKGELSFPQKPKLSTEVKNLISQCLNVVPTSRPIVSKILLHEWFQKFTAQNIEDFFTQSELRQLHNVQQISPHSDDPIKLLTEIQISDYNQSKKIKNENLIPNIIEKSIVYAPFNTTIESNEQQFNVRKQWRIEYNIIHFRTMVREANRQYEYNYNGELDNGVLISQNLSTSTHRLQPLQMLSQDDSIQSAENINNRQRQPQVSLVTDQSLLMLPQTQQHSRVIFNENQAVKQQQIQLNSLVQQDKMVQMQDIDMLVVCKIENEFGYPEQFIVDSLKSNLKNDATTCYYLFRMEDKDEIVNLL